MSTKFTPGPWRTHRTHPRSPSTWFVICNSDGSGPIMDVGGNDCAGQIAEAKHLITDPQEIEANAHLIAAAPEMYEALDTALMALASAHGVIRMNSDGHPSVIDKCECESGRAYRTALAALKKARGE